MQPVLLKCYIGKSGDRENVLLLYERKLVVIFKGAAIEYSFDQLRGIFLVKKKLIIPLVVGGIGTCLSWLALSLGWYHYQLNLFAVFAFFGWMYYGFIGRDALEITEKKHSQIYLVKANHFVLNSYLKFVRQRLWSVNQPVTSEIYHLTKKDEWESQSRSEYYQHDSLISEGFIHTSYAGEVVNSYEKYFHPNDQLVLLGISLSLVESPVKMEFVESRNASFPHVHGKLNKSSILLLRSIDSPNDLASLFGNII